METLKSSGGQITKAAEDFTLPEVVEVFELDYSTVASPDSATVEAHTWKIEDSKLDFKISPCLASLVKNYSENFDRSSKTMCRTAIDFILNECLTALKDDIRMAAENDRKTSGRQQEILPPVPTPCDDIRIYGEVAFNHQVFPSSKARSSPGSPTLTVNGRLDYDIGRIISWAETERRRRFQCLMIVQAKAQSAVNEALPQLLVYLACLRQSRRLQRKRADSSVYGVTSDGYEFVFVMITHKGTVKISKTFHVLQGEMTRVLGWLTYILKMTAATSSNVILGKAVENLDDPQIDLDDNDYTNPPDSDNED